MKFFLILFLPFLLPDKNNCTCFRLPVEQEVQNSGLIVKAKVLTIDTIYNYSDYYGIKNTSVKEAYESRSLNLSVKLLQSKVYKGSLNADTLSIITGIGGGDCGYPFIQGIDYIIYAHQYTFIEVEKRKAKYFATPVLRYKTTSCSRTTPVIQEEDSLLRRYLLK